jgi:hypothetical protein
MSSFYTVYHSPASWTLGPGTSASKTKPSQRAVQNGSLGEPCDRISNHCAAISQLRSGHFLASLLCSGDLLDGELSCCRSSNRTPRPPLAQSMSVAAIAHVHSVLLSMTSRSFNANLKLPFLRCERGASRCSRSRLSFRGALNVNHNPGHRARRYCQFIVSLAVGQIFGERLWLAWPTVVSE